MSSRKITDRRGLAGQDLDHWPQVDPSAFRGGSSNIDEQTFNKRSKAIRMYAENHSLKEIFDATSVSKQDLYRLVDRCLETDSDGRPYGFLGLLRYRHLSSRKIDINKLQRRPTSGSLAALFARYPSVAKALTDYALFGKRKGLRKREVTPTVAAIHYEFIQLCDDAKIRSPQYPFNSDSEGKPAIRRWTNKIRLENQLAYLTANDPEAAKTATARSPDSEIEEGSTRSFKRVECDGHRIDVHCTIEIPSPSGDGLILAQISRLWIIVLIEVMSGAILGYSISFGANYSAVDVMRALRNSLIPWKKRQLTVKTMDYRIGDGFPSGVVDGLSFACFDELCLDNAKSHLSRLFLGYLERTVGAVPIFSPGRTPNSHAYVEGFFNILEEAGIHQTIGTTGSKASDIRRTKKTDDLRYYLSYELLCDLIDLLIARINGTSGPNSSISRLDALRRVASRKTSIIRRIPMELRAELTCFDMCEEGIIGKNHTRPVVRFFGANYTNDVLASAFLLIGRSIVIHADSEDLRKISCTLDDGTSLGQLYAERRWRQTRHGLTTRREAARLYNKGGFRTASDIPKAFRLHVESEAKKSKRAASQLKRLQIEQDSSRSEESTDAPIEEMADIDKSTKQTTDLDRIEDAAYEEAYNLLKNIRTQYR